ncbi:hypothetical protein [Paraburkholderia flava]|uniref:hypothetical protein n=1 Tax=Paraburkholderia flava TaxID=2547393 RepID=UPI00105D6DE1|nr:hypothetical protein [Paraburkholderia flava]
MQDDAGTAACAIERLETKKAGDEFRLKPRLEPQLKLRVTDKPSCIKNYPIRDGRRCLETPRRTLVPSGNPAAN